MKWGGRWPNLKHSLNSQIHQCRFLLAWRCSQKAIGVFEGDQSSWSGQWEPDVISNSANPLVSLLRVLMDGNSKLETLSLDNNTHVEITEYVLAKIKGRNVQISFNVHGSIHRLRKRLSKWKVKALNKMHNEATFVAASHFKKFSLINFSCSSFQYPRSSSPCVSYPCSSFRLIITSLVFFHLSDRKTRNQDTMISRHFPCSLVLNWWELIRKKKLTPTVIIASIFALVTKVCGCLIDHLAEPGTFPG